MRPYCMSPAILNSGLKALSIGRSTVHQGERAFFIKINEQYENGGKQCAKTLPIF